MHPCSPLLRWAVLPTAVLFVTLILSLPTHASVEAARADIAAGDLSTAAVRLRSALRSDDTDPEANALMARLYLDRQQPQLALVVLAKAEAGGRTREELLPLYAEAWRLSGDDANLRAAADALASDLPAPTRDAVLIEHALAQLAGGAPKPAAETLSGILDGPQATAAKVAMARVALANGALDRARELLSAAIAEDPTSTDAWMLLGDIAGSQGDAGAAERAYTSALVDAGGRAWLVHFRRAEARLRAGNIPAATEDIDALAAQYPDYPGLPYLRGVATLQQGNAAPAAEILETALRANPTEPRLLYATARAMLALGRFEQALDLAGRLVSAQPNNPTAARLLARAQLGNGDSQAAIATLETLVQASNRAATDLLFDYARALQGHPNRANEARAVLEEVVARGDATPSAQLELARVLVELDRHGDAIARIQAYRREHPDDASAARLEIQALLAVGQVDQAVAQARAWVDMAPESAQAHLSLSLALLAAGDTRASDAALAQAERLTPSATSTQLELARRDIHTGKVEAAAERLADLAAERPEDSRILLTAAQLEHSVSQDNDALIATLRQALDRNPEEPLLRRNLVSILVQIGRTDDALAVLAQRPEMVRKDPGLLRLQVAAAQATGNTGLAREAVETLLQIAPESATAHQSLARILAASGGGREMEEAFLEALRLDPESPQAAATLAVVMDATKAPDERERIAEAMNRALPGHYLVKLARAQVALRATDYGEAAEAFRDALDMKPDDRSALMGLVAALSRLGKQQDAANALAAWTTRHPDDLAARYDLAVTLERAGDTAGAVEIYEALLGDRPEHWMAMNNLAMLLLDGDPRRALSLAQRAQELNKESGAILDTLGLAALANDQPEHAVDALSAAREKAPTDPRIALHLAEALVAAGRPAEASPILMEISTRRFPGRADAQSLLEQLRQGR